MGRLPRGAIPSPRNAIAAAEPYRADATAQVFVPSGRLPTSNAELAAARPYQVGHSVSDQNIPESFVHWPVQVGQWANDSLEASNWAEEAFAKACAQPHIFVPAESVSRAAQECRSSNLAEFMQKRGFHVDRKAYLNGPYYAVDWMDAAVLHSALARVGPVKMVVTFEKPGGEVPGTPSLEAPDWIALSAPRTLTSTSCVSIFGYGSLKELLSSFEAHGTKIDLPSALTSTLTSDPCYAVFVAGSLGIIDRQSLIGRAYEAWVRNPTTIVRDADK